MYPHAGRSRFAANNATHGVLRSYASQLKEHEPLFTTYEHLQGLPRSDNALTLLRKVASLVKPIMRKHGWKVQVLAEFLPPEANLLGLNIDRGAKICIRLRFHNNPDLFLPVEQIVDTMLHELSHNVHGPHDAKFHELWDELREEHDLLVRKGYTGEGFLSEGHRLGGGGSGGGKGRSATHDEMRRLARASAEKRQAQNALANGSGNRLGGTPLHLLGRDVRQVIADQVTRRNTINKGCGSGRNDAVLLSDQSAINSFSTKAEEDDANDRAIAQALQELAEEEEERNRRSAFATASASGGLAWHPQNGLYDPRKESPGTDFRQPSREEEDLKRAIQESLRSTSQGLAWDRDNGLYNPERETVPASNAPSRNLLSSHERPAYIRVSSAPQISQSSRANQPATVPRAHQVMDDNATLPAHEPPNAPNAQDTNCEDQLQESTNSRAVRSTSSRDSDFVIDLSEPFDPRAPDPNAPPPGHWACEVCTCINPTQFLACDACSAERPQTVGIGNRGPLPRRSRTISVAYGSEPRGSLGWLCKSCGAFMEHRWWACSACGKVKDSS